MTRKIFKNTFLKKNLSKDSPLITVRVGVTFSTYDLMFCPCHLHATEINHAAYIIKHFYNFSHFGQEQVYYNVCLQL